MVKEPWALLINRMEVWWPISDAYRRVGRQRQECENIPLMITICNHPNVEEMAYYFGGPKGKGICELDHREPEPPSSFGYTWGHTQLKFAQKCALKSLNAFQRLLGYCTYSISGCTSLQPLSLHAAFYSDRGISELYQKLNPNNPDVHILAKLLLSMLWKMCFSGNHTGVVLAYNDNYDYVHVSTAMMEQLDVVYRQHFQGEESLTLLDCFDIDNIKSGQVKFALYTNDMKVTLERGGSSRTEKGPQKYGIKQAEQRVAPVLFPFEGRFNLPLATVSMLDDLKTCILADQTVVTQVRGFFRSYSTSSLTD